MSGADGPTPIPSTAVPTVAAGKPSPHPTPLPSHVPSSLPTSSPSYDYSVFRTSDLYVKYEATIDNIEDELLFSIEG